MSRLGKRVTRVETLTGLRALDAYRNLPLQKWPDWALASVILGRRVTTAEMRPLERDDAFWRQIDEMVGQMRSGKMDAQGPAFRRRLQELWHRTQQRRPDT
jgi:hypothetical protein